MPVASSFAIQPEKTTSSSQPVKETQPVPLHLTSSLPDPSTASDADLLLEEYGPVKMEVEKPLYTAGGILPPTGTSERFDAFGSTTSLDQELLADLYELDPPDEMKLLGPELPDAAPSILPAVELPSSPNVSVEPDPAIVKKLHDSLTLLPKEMQEVFVERMVESIADPECFKEHVMAIQKLAMAATEEAKRRVSAASLPEGGSQQPTSEEPPVIAALPIAAATLGAFLAQYSSAFKNRRCSLPRDEKRPSLVPLEG